MHRLGIILALLPLLLSPGLAQQGGCTPWNGNTITSSTSFIIYSVNMSSWIGSAILNTGSAPRVLALKSTPLRFSFINVNTFTSPEGLGIQGPLQAQDGFVFDGDDSGRYVTNYRAGYSFLHWNFVIAPWGFPFEQAPNVRLFVTPAVGEPNPPFRLGVNLEIGEWVIGRSKPNLDFKLHICPTCEGGCGNGYCSGPNVCTCNAFWTGPNCQTSVCATSCQRGGTCAGVNTCICPASENGFTNYFNYYCDIPYKTIPQSSSAAVGTFGSFVLSGIIKLTSSGATGRIFDKVTAGYADGWLMDSLNGRYRIILGSSIFVGSAAPAIPYNQYQFATLTYKPDVGWGGLYINGNWVCGFYSPNLPANNQPWRVGFASDNSNVFPGTIERARFYVGVLSDSQIQEDFNRAKAEYPSYSFAPVVW